jgi:hypothetical protein
MPVERAILQSKFFHLSHASYQMCALAVIAKLGRRDLDMMK